MDVGERAEELVDVELDFEDGHDSLHLVEVARCSVDGFRDVLEHEVKIDFVLLWLKLLATRIGGLGWLLTHTRSPLL